MNSKQLTLERAQEAAAALDSILRRRTHPRKVLGQTLMVPGKLGDALRLPQIRSALASKMAHRREAGLQQFRDLWPTLSQHTRSTVLEQLGWYEAESLDWEDKRSNRRPTP